MASGKEGPGRADGGRLVFVVSTVFVEERRSGGGSGGGVGVIGGHFGGAVAGSHAGPAALDERSRGRRCRTSQDTHLPLHKVIFETGMVDHGTNNLSRVDLAGRIWTSWERGVPGLRCSTHARVRQITVQRNQPNDEHVFSRFLDALGRLDDKEDVIRDLCLDIVTAVPMCMNSEDIDVPETQAFVGHACKIILLHADDSDGDIRKKCIGTIAISAIIEA